VSSFTKVESIFFLSFGGICYNFKNSKIKRWEGEGLVTKILLTKKKKKKKKKKEISTLPKIHD